ncbi:MAG: hypothetical protein ACJAXU_000730, partial [Paracoccaceae bacterium]
VRIISRGVMKDRRCFPPQGEMRVLGSSVHSDYRCGATLSRSLTIANDPVRG